MAIFRRFFVCLIGLICVCATKAQTQSLNATDSVTAVVARFVAGQSAAIRVKVLSIQGNAQAEVVDIRLNEPFSYLSFRPDGVRSLKESIRNVLPEAYKKCQIRIYCEGKTIEDWTTHLHENKKERWVIMPDKAEKCWVRNLSRPYELKKGLQGRHLALWNSHGLYFSQRLECWHFQRPALFSTNEDLLTGGFVLTYLVPMLENAGAVVALPRERDFNPNEVVVDNDDEGSTLLSEGNKPWIKGGIGFGNTQKLLLSGENPFVMGNFLQCETTAGENPSEIQWIPDIPEKGFYAVYVSYKSVENSITDARYTVFHLGGQTEFLVNQKIGAGTWVYLGSFLFDKGHFPENSVVLSSKSKVSKGVVTADAVRFGGGIGNIARNSGAPDFRKAESSGYPRAVEGARYWLQWAGMPDSIYNNSKDVDDYKDDINSRPLWVNYLSGGSRVNPKTKGLGVPLDLAMGFHTDAGVSRTDSVVGTLGIYTLKEGKERFTSGQHSLLSRDLTDWIQCEIVHSVHQNHESKWLKRGMWNKRYAESRIPEIPTTLLELLSHQNYFDMKYGLDPHFRFTVSRAIYKGILKYIAATYGVEYQIQPLPVETMKAEFVAKNEVQLSWSPVADPLEPSALPKAYILYQRVGEGGFDNGTLVADTVVRVSIQTDTFYSFKVAAWNEGGESFPSETLSAYLNSKSKGTALVVNGFTRLGAPFGAADSISGGFDYRMDAGVPYGKNYTFTGFQVEKDRLLSWKDNDDPGFGASYLNFVGKPIYGNSFDYTMIHGRALVEAGYSYTSCSEKALSSMDLGFYSLLDLYYGKQKETLVGGSTRYSILGNTTRKALSEYLNGGGTLLLSGAYLGSESWRKNDDLKRFVQTVLKSSFRTSFATASGEVRGFQGGLQLSRSSMLLPMTINGYPYGLESVDALEPSSKAAKQILLYADGNKAAGTLFKGKYGVCVLGFPFEAIQSENDRTVLMRQILKQLK